MVQSRGEGWKSAGELGRKYYCGSQVVERIFFVWSSNDSGLLKCSPMYETLANVESQGKVYYASFTLLGKGLFLQFEPVTFRSYGNNFTVASRLPCNDSGLLRLIIASHAAMFFSALPLDNIPF